MKPMTINKTALNMDGAVGSPVPVLAGGLKATAQALSMRMPSERTEQGSASPICTVCFHARSHSWRVSSSDTAGAPYLRTQRPPQKDKCAGALPAPSSGVKRLK
eukprot:14635210-Alexandrium_andersonii.AAC.1